VEAPRVEQDGGAQGVLDADGGKAQVRCRKQALRRRSMRLAITQHCWQAAVPDSHTTRTLVCCFTMELQVQVRLSSPNVAELTGFCDSDMAGDVVLRQSTSGMLFVLRSSPIS
jgi:hypothetical protein